VNWRMRSVSAIVAKLGLPSALMRTKKNVIEKKQINT
jgi:hypothetical protein